MSKKMKRWGRFVLPIVVLAGVGLLAGKWQADRLSARTLHVAQTGQAAIRLLSDYTAGLKHLDPKAIVSLYDDAYANPQEGFWHQQLREKRDGVQVYTWEQEGLQAFTKADQAEQWKRYFASVSAVDEAKFRLDKVDDLTQASEPVIRSALWVVGRNHAGEVFESMARFRMWLRQDERGWFIRRQELLDGTTVIGNQQGFADVTEQAGIDFVSNYNPILKTPEWELKRMGIGKYVSGGVTAADYDNDGWYDIFFADPARSRLYRNNGDGTFAEVTAAAGLPTKTPGVSLGFFADFDNDGDQDLFLGAITANNQLYRNNGDGTFTDVSEQAGLGSDFVTSAAVADYDRDGKLDLYLGRYLDPRTQLPTTLFYSRNGKANILLRNLGQLRFADVTAEAGVGDTGLTFSPVWGDYDQDGDPDLYVVNDFGRNVLYRNNSDGTFTDVTMETGTMDMGLGMSGTFADIDNDGDLDLYTSNVHSAQRWYGQATVLYQYLMTSVWEGTLLTDLPLYREIYHYMGADWSRFLDQMGKGNSLLLNDGRGQFTDVSEATGTNPFGWYWGSTMFDYDNDGRQDIYAANGWISSKSKDDL